MQELAIRGGNKVRTRPFAPHGVMGAAEAEAVCKVVRSQNLWRFGEGERAVERFEEAFGRLHHGVHAVAVNSGTSALHTALGATEISPGDEVIVPPLTWFATATACLHQGAIPIFADVDASTGMLTAQTVAACLTPRTRAVMVVHL